MTNSVYLDPLPALLIIEFEGEEPRFVPEGGAVFVQAQMDRIVAWIAAEVKHKKKPAILSWQEASKGVVTKHQMRLTSDGVSALWQPSERICR